MPSLDSQHIFRRNRDRAAQRVRPEGRRTHQNAHTDPRDISAGGMYPFVKEDPAENKFERDTCDDREQRLLITFEYAERQVTGQQNAGNERRRDVAVVEADQRLALGWSPGRSLGRSLGGQNWRGRLLAHAGSFILCNWLGARLSMVWTLPDGQRITALSMCGFLPRPKCNRRSFCA